MCLLSRFPFLFLFVFLFGISDGFSQTYKNDSLAVRAILDSNGLKTVTVEEVTITDTSRIIEFLLFFENISKIPPQIGNLTALKVLYLFFNNISYLPGDIGKLKNLVELRLGSNLLTDLPYEIGDLPNLRILDLSANSLDSIPFTIGNLKNLDSLYLQNNNIKVLPVEIGLCTNLKNLMLGVNSLDAIPQQIGTCTQIISLGLEYNRLTILPASITTLKPTLFCDLGYNRLSTMSDASTILWADTYDPDWRKTQEVIAPITTVVQHNGIAAPRICVAGNSLFLSIRLTGAVSLNLYSCQGRLIRTLLNRTMAAGSYTIPLPTIHYCPGMCIAVLQTAGGASVTALTIVP